jgi:hypothetical protein
MHAVEHSVSNHQVLNKQLAGLQQAYLAPSELRPGDSKYMVNVEHLASELYDENQLQLLV